jgi:hypothetical protein
MNDKYYTPEETDIHLNYECEIRCPHCVDKSWEKFIVTKDFLAKGYSESMFYSDEDVRTKYLDIEDIESCGFKFIKNHNFHNFTECQEFNKENISKDEDNDYYGNFYKLFYLTNSKLLTIEKLNVREDIGEPYYDLYEGNQNHIVERIKCNSINELKLIMKLLEIPCSR